jgi:hypothetical protein
MALAHAQAPAATCEYQAPLHMILKLFHLRALLPCTSLSQSCIMLRCCFCDAAAFGAFKHHTCVRTQWSADQLVLFVTVHIHSHDIKWLSKLTS